MKKLMGSKSWYRRKRKAVDEEEEQVRMQPGCQEVIMKGHKRRKLEWDSKEEGKRIPTRSVLFVEYSKESQLARKVKEVLEKL